MIPGIFDVYVLACSQVQLFAPTCAMLYLQTHACTACCAAARAFSCSLVSMQYDSMRPKLPLSFCFSCLPAPCSMNARSISHFAVILFSFTCAVAIKPHIDVFECVVTLLFYPCLLSTESSHIPCICTPAAHGLQRGRHRCIRHPMCFLLAALLLILCLAHTLSHSSLSSICLPLLLSEMLPAYTHAW